MATPADLLGRVKKLLALSTSTNVHEAAAAAAAAQHLIARHQLDDLLAAERAADSDDDPISDGTDAPLEISKRLRRYKVVLAQALADNGGGVAWSHEASDGTHLCFCGRASDRASVTELYQWLLRRIEWLSASSGPGQPRSWHEAFRIGAVDVIAARLAVPDAEPAEAAALLKTEPLRAARAAAVTRFVDEHLRLGTGKGFRIDARGFARGKEVAQSMNLASSSSSSSTTKDAKNTKEPKNTQR